MDKLTGDNIECKKENTFSKIWSRISSKENENTADSRDLLRDILLFSVGFLLSRCHLLFGVRPLGLSFLCAMQIGIWPTLWGSVIGALSMGKDGIIFAVCCAVGIFLRVAIGYSDKKGIFYEATPIRMSISVLSAFISAVFEVLRFGLNESSLLFGLSMIILSPVLTFIFSGLFTEQITLDLLLSSDKDVFSLNDREKGQKFEILFFQLSSLMLLFFIGLSFRGVDILGISAPYIFSSAITLIVGKRFGALRGLAVGFASSLGISGVLSVSFALAGLAAGALFHLGTGYAILGGGIAICAFSAYSSGLTGLLSTLPEYAIATALILPILKQINQAQPEINESVQDNCAEDMVGTMALAYQNEYRGNTERLEYSLMSISSIIKGYANAPGILNEEEYQGIVVGVAERCCIGCESKNLCATEGIRPCINNSKSIARELLSGKRISASHINTDTEFCSKAEKIADNINRETTRAERENYMNSGNLCSAKEFELISRLISEARENDLEETKVNSDLTPTLTDILNKHALNGTARAFGKRKKHFIICCEDEDGRKITSEKLRKDIEEVAKVTLGHPEYFRKDKMVLMECSTKRKLSVSVATANMTGSKSEISGDNIIHFQTDSDYYYTVLSDGMGSGEIARDTSMFVCDFLRSTLRICGAKDSIFHMLNHLLKSRKEECSATLDLLEIDLLSGEGKLFKSGAAASFVKRGSSIFRIRSQTAPLGLLSSIDTEKTKVDIKPGDYLIMLSDGIADETDDASWLLLFLGEPIKCNLQEYANLILKGALHNTSATDDMSVAVVKIEEA